MLRDMLSKEFFCHLIVMPGILYAFFLPLLGGIIGIYWVLDSFVFLADDTGSSDLLVVVDSFIFGVSETAWVAIWVYVIFPKITRPFDWALQQLE